MNEPQRNNVILDRAGAAQWLGAKYRPDATPFNVSTINRWMKNRGLPHAKIGREVAIDADDLEKWAANTFHRGVRFDR